MKKPPHPDPLAKYRCPHCGEAGFMPHLCSCWGGFRREDYPVGLFGILAADDESPRTTTSACFGIDKARARNLLPSKKGLLNWRKYAEESK